MKAALNDSRPPQRHVIWSRDPRTDALCIERQVSQLTLVEPRFVRDLGRADEDVRFGRILDSVDIRQSQVERRQEDEFMESQAAIAAGSL
jgi:hypothetical protein